MKVTTALSIILPILTTQTSAWNDIVGVVPDGYFSILFTRPLMAHTFPHILLMVESAPSIRKNLPCGDWTSVDSALPWTVDIHTPNGFSCSGLDNVWVKYSDQFLNLPTDGRCETIAGGASKRCIIAA